MSNENNMDTDTYTVKLEYNNNLHRFSIKDKTFETLMSTIRGVVHLDADAAVQVRYCDDEGDYVTFDSEHELAEALSHSLSPSGVLRVQIELADASAAEPAPLGGRRFGGRGGRGRFGRGGRAGRFGGGRFGRGRRGPRGPFAKWAVRADDSAVVACGHCGGGGGIATADSDNNDNVGPRGAFRAWRERHWNVQQTREQDEAMWKDIPEHIRQRILNRHNVEHEADATDGIALFDALSDEVKMRVRRRSKWHATFGRKNRGRCHWRRAGPNHRFGGRHPHPPHGGHPHGPPHGRHPHPPHDEPKTSEEKEAIWSQLPERARRRILTRHGAQLGDDADVSNVAFFDALPPHVQHRLAHRVANRGKFAQMNRQFKSLDIADEPEEDVAAECD